MGSPMRIAAALSDGPRGAIMLSPVTRSSLSPTSLAATALARNGSRPLSAVKFVQVTEAGVEIPYVHPRSSSSGSHAYPLSFSLPRVPGSAAANANSRARSPRDSMVSRQSPGRPGSRRHQRWMNEMQLKQPIEPDELRSLFLVTTEGSFSFLWSGGGQAAKLMSDFLDITEEQQHEMLAASESSKAPAGSRRRQIAGAADKFVRLNCKARDLFRRGVGLNTLASIEQRLIEYLDSNQTESLECHDMTTPMHRLVAHAVAEFHGCSSRTHSRPDGSRFMSIQKTPASAATQPTLMYIVTALLEGEKSAAANAAGGAAVSRGKKKQREQRLMRDACSSNVTNPFSSKGVAAAEAAFASSVVTVAAAARLFD